MSDSIKKYFEMVEDGIIEDKTFIYESPDKGKTVTRRPFNGSVSEREVVSKPEINSTIKKDAYTILSIYSEDSIRLAAKILDIGE